MSGWPIIQYEVRGGVLTRDLSVPSFLSPPVESGNGNKLAMSKLSWVVVSMLIVTMNLFNHVLKTLSSILPFLDLMTKSFFFF